jgi:hypothetical protein
MSPPPSSDGPDRRRRSLLGAGAALIVVGVALLAWLFLAGVGDRSIPSAASPAAVSAGSPTPSPVRGAVTAPPPTAAPDADGGAQAAPPTAPAPPDAAAVITSFTVTPTTVECPDERSGAVALSVSWATEGADRAWIGVGTTDAAAQPFAEVPTAAAGYSDLDFDCGVAQKLFTLTVEADGVRTSRTIAVDRQLP